MEQVNRFEELAKATDAFAGYKMSRLIRGLAGD